MDTELLARAKTQDIEREIARIHLAKRAEASCGRAAPKPKVWTAPAIPLRLLRALRPAS